MPTLFAYVRRGMSGQSFADAELNAGLNAAISRTP